MDTVKIDELRREISALASSKRLTRTRRLEEVLSVVGEDLIQAAARGVTMKNLSETVGKHLGFAVSVSTLRNHLQQVDHCGEATEMVERILSSLESETPSAAPFIEANRTPPQVETGAPIKKTYQCQGGGSHFIAMAMSPDDRLFQLEHAARVSGRRGGAYQVYEVDKAGRLHVRNGSGYPDPVLSKPSAIDGFRAWGAKMGYEVTVNEG